MTFLSRVLAPIKKALPFPGPTNRPATSGGAVVLTPLGDPSTSTPLSRDRRYDGFPQGGKDHSSPRSGWSALRPGASLLWHAHASLRTPMPPFRPWVRVLSVRALRRRRAHLRRRRPCGGTSPGQGERVGVARPEGRYGVRQRLAKDGRGRRAGSAGARARDGVLTRGPRSLPNASRRL